MIKNYLSMYNLHLVRIKLKESEKMNGNNKKTQLTVEGRAVKELYKRLMETKFSFISSGHYHIQTIYNKVKLQFPDLCEDYYLCIDSCSDGDYQPEWKHRVRAALGNLKEKSLVKKGSHGYWVIIG